ncbi:MAG TPA: HAD-IIIA family hydrolase [Geothermobacteraceae bacterium]|nr:HAD-IIIA family hydrolase [Geothermobacteraceae bacterium]
MQNKLSSIKMLLLDVDGVLTDGRVIINDSGAETKAFDVRDGHGLKLLQRAGIDVGIITGRNSAVVAHRMRELGIELVYQGVKDKLEPFNEILERFQLSPQQVAYIGDDIVDLPVLRRVGFAATVADACPDLFERVDFVSSRPGGRGAVREVCEMLLKTQGYWEELTRRYFVD